jgi:ubiquitin-protein ligase
MTTNKRLLHEIKRLYIQQNQKPLLENEYLVYFDETNINRVQTIIKAPYDSVYRHKFIRLDFEIPEDYPFSPPKVYFVNYDSVRIHPNMYEDGKCCSTILNTWPSDNERWTSSMGIETILLTFRSFLDNNPYTFEPGGHDDTTYTDFVLYQSWKTCLFRYLENEQPEIFTEYIEQYIYHNITEIFRYLSHLEYLYEIGYYETRCFEIDLFFVNYFNIIFELDIIYKRIKSEVEAEGDSEADVEGGHVNEGGDVNEGDDVNFDCNICFDTRRDIEREIGVAENAIGDTEREIGDAIITLECSHTFHELCLISHGKNNGDVCPLCRSHYQLKPKKRELTEIINPETKRRIKVGGKVYQDLLDRGVLD